VPGAGERVDFDSGGEPRQYESASAKIEDIRAAVRYLRSRPDVDPEGVGALGVCFGAGHVVAASIGGPEIRSLATVAAWLHDRESLLAAFGPEEIARRYRVGRAAREAWEKSRQVETVPAASATDKTAAMLGVDYYGDPGRGTVPQWTNAMATMSWPEWLDFDAVALASRVTAPLLMVHSDGSALPDNVRRFHASVQGPKDLYWTEGNHTDFYDRAPFVARAADAVAAHFGRTLR
jgi:fermentation-respiration switch protein FrsA (DUF1100 family)